MTDRGQRQEERKGYQRIQGEDHLGVDKDGTRAVCLSVYLLCCTFKKCLVSR